MGTRHLIAVQYNRRYKVAQYGQWDGYPSGQGVRVLEFLRSVDLEEFKKKVKALRWVRKGMMEKVFREIGLPEEGGWMTLEQGAIFEEKHPEWSRNTGAKILPLIMERKLHLQNSIEFAGDGLFCEWGYVVDLDSQTFEIYSGFHKGPLPTNGRFEKYDNPESEYRPVSLVKLYSLDNLPTQEQFLGDLQPQEEE